MPSIASENLFQVPRRTLFTMNIIEKLIFVRKKGIPSFIIPSLGIMVVISMIIVAESSRIRQIPWTRDRYRQSQQPSFAPSNNSSNTIQSCGASPREARAGGCHFDLISFSWLPEPCYDSELAQDFDNLREWKWWFDENNTVPASHQLAMTGEYSLFVEWDYHLWHCTFMWRKMHRALSRSGQMAIDSYMGSYNHTLHCEEMLLRYREIELNSVNTVIRVKYPDCNVGLSQSAAWGR